MNNTWDLTILYTGFNDAKFSEDMKGLTEAVGEAAALAASENKESEEFIKEYLTLAEKISNLVSKLYIFSSLSYSANTRDSAAASAMGRIMGELSSYAASAASLAKKIAEIPNLESIIEEDASLSEYAYLLKNIKRDNKYLLSDREEAMFAKLDISGANAWSDLQSSLTSNVKVNYDGKEITLSSARNLAYDPSQKVRSDAYEAELLCYDKIKDPAAFALNSIKLQVLSECELRGYESPLAKTLYTSRMKKETLDALLSAMEEYMPVFRKYLKAKAKALGHKGGLPWYDLFAPMGKSEKTYTVEEARDYLLAIFAKFDARLYNLVKEAFDNSWIDFYPREGKVGGAFDCGVPSAKVSRVLTNFDGSFSDVVTLAHELGHSFHDRQVFSHSVLCQDYSMPVAETASTFNEILVMNTAIKEAESDEERLLLIESQIMDSCQIICDIYSRYKFEESVFEHRPNEFMNADRLSELMINAQKLAYGDGLDESFMHPYMWLCKGHYYSASLSFYNFPYAFGGLFARGLYAKYMENKDTFADTYVKLLNQTSVSDVEETALVAGIDLTCREFWCEGLETIAKDIEEFCRIVGYEDN